jgi:hypothetical protein
MRKQTHLWVIEKLIDERWTILFPHCLDRCVFTLKRKAEKAKAYHSRYGKRVYRVSRYDGRRK